MNGPIRLDATVDVNARPAPDTEEIRKARTWLERVLARGQQAAGGMDHERRERDGLKKMAS
jgi:hypothetical protein